MNVTMNTTTHFAGQKYEEGKPYEVDTSIAERWVDVGIAEEGGTPKASGDSGEKPVEKMNTAELTAKAEELGVDISEAKTNKERADLILAHIEASGDGGEDNKEE